jgi:hypothetical protein
MTDTSSLRAFIEARLAEDELWALAASATRDGKTQPGGVHWTWATGDNWDPVQPDPLQPYMGGYDGQWSQAVTLRSVEEWDTSVGPLPLHIADSEELRTADGAHIVRHDPARVFREVAAKRAILQRYEIAGIGAEATAGTVLAGASRLRMATLDDVLLALASVWSDHPDYRPEWSTA